MQSQLVFQEEKEMQRLGVQNQLLRECETGIFAQIFRGKSGLAVLDIGSNDGAKTVERFSDPAVKTVIGIEYNASLALQAQEIYGGEKFAFYSLDAEKADFSANLRARMAERGIEGFDVIYLSFILMHMRDAQALLRVLRPLLKRDGQLVIIEANDASSTLTGDEEGLLKEFLSILDRDRYSGNRKTGANLPAFLKAAGYGEITVWCDAIRALPGETERKKAVFTTFFSYLPEDVALLLEAEPDNGEYKKWAGWLAKNYRKLENGILRADTEIKMGMQVISCTKGEEDLQ